MDRPRSGKSACLKNVCLAQFALYYYKKSTSENDYKPEILKEDIEDKDNYFAIGLPNKLCGAGAGKSYLMKIISMFLTKTMNLYSGSPDKPKVLLLAPIRSLL